MASSRHSGPHPDPSGAGGRGSTAYPPDGQGGYGPGEQFRDSFSEPYRRSPRASTWRAEPRRRPWLARKRVLFPLAFIFGVAAMLGASWLLTPEGQEVMKATQRLVQPQKTLADAFGAPGATVLLVGLDHIPARRGELQLRHSDSIMLATTDFETKQVRMVSIPRDGWAEQRSARGELHQDKLAHTYSNGQQLNADDPEGGVRNTMDSIRRLLRLDQPITYYVVVDPLGFVELIDALGGIEIDVDRRMKYRDRRGGLNIDLQPGVQKLNGEQAMGFARFRREALGDIARMGRQQIVIRTMLEEMKQPHNLPRLPQLFSIFNEHVQTNMSLDQLLALAQHLGDFSGESIQTMTIENYGPNDGPEYPLAGEPRAHWAQFIPPRGIEAAREFLSNLDPPPPPAADLDGDGEPDTEADDQAGLTNASL